MKIRNALTALVLGFSLMTFSPSTAEAGMWGMDGAQEEAAMTAVGSGATFLYTTGSAAMAGAGSLAGYAGAASAVSSLGLSSVTTAIAGALGSSATGAAATAVVVSAVGGPVVFGAAVVAGTGVLGYGLYRIGEAIGGLCD